MKKKAAFLSFMFMLIGLGLIHSQTITVTNPTAGKVWCKGQSYDITWTKTGTMPNFVKIWLRNPASTQTILEISAQTENDGSFSWPVPASIANGNYRIRVVTGGGAIWGDSGIFEIDNCGQGSITVTKPTANDVWCKGKTHNIQWTKSGQLPNTVRIVLLNEPGTASVQVIDPGTANNGSYDWKIPDTIADGKYRIRIRAVEGGVLGTFGDSPVFTIKKCKPVFKIYYITVSEPHDGAHWDGGETRNIEWETNYKSQLKIQLYDYDGKNLVRNITSVRMFSTTAPKKYRFPWPIPTDISPGNYTIRISNQTDTVKGLSKKFFIRQKLVTQTYLVPVTTVNKCRWHEHDSRTDYPIVGKEFVSPLGEYPDPGAGKMRVGFQNYYHSSDYHKHYIYRSFLGVNVDPYKGKGFFLKATLQYVPTPLISQPAAKGDLRLFYLDEAWNGTWEHLFNIKANILSSSTDVTQVVKDWLLGTSPNYGFLMVGPNEMMQNNSDYCIYITTKVMLKLEFLQQAQ
jgi:hypothetical protein